MNFEVRTLRWYIAVAEELHFARAAKTLNIARTKLSGAVIELEAELGYPLFVPGASPTQLTAEGAEFLATARVLVEQEDERLRDETALKIAQLQTLVVGYTEGVTPTKWTRIWADRFPGVTLELVPSTVDTQLPMLHEASIDVGFVRLPVDRTGLSVIGLYEEVPVVVVPKDHAVAAFDRIDIADLADEHLLQEPDTVPEWAALATEIIDGSRLPLPPVTSSSELMEYVAAGLGIAVLPQSIARLNARKDLVYRPIDGVAGSHIALAWLADKTTENVEEFLGIVRGRSVRSSRGANAEPSSTRTASKKAAAKKKAQPDRSGKPQRKAPTRGKPKR
ncbi:LysR substrate-binding domain-containing protein [Rhodococcus sp. G-MC3]|uniref:LysR family transcriptional regulator n=1 Tax=Rhodococcus sp. G-MC3 TaxID=3046209 RepID=UPI0024B9E581|nr:LysR substrate-binding domain-containing protein [Rhodococcus sp. G-MC3]MDJ0393132.1 LysR substrate-binding domain-containing protein [Rhodococcus sp. G-MC3]